MGKKLDKALLGIHTALRAVSWIVVIAVLGIFGITLGSVLANLTLEFLALLGRV